ncbi:hypothetical protein [Stenotrophomonas oahuensis]|mgnify:CR=1 FL=1|uniref:Uncharacterized protein n=1 Tax=Stenotrophomonas oahuensis TaxID=3003271 RepID=A0ABY9YJZ1_9GAMM|nr:hypothetical protein [Stenotrophomonas sp. A5586]WNH51156.1 hypothetical protein PDM29_12340 [Stenotrophomonas sp. A5586]
MAVTLDNYYTLGWREQAHTCAACEWRGTARDMVMELHEDETEFDCPECENPILLVVHPTLAQLQAAAAEGHPEAIEQLEILAAAPRPD